MYEGEPDQRPDILRGPADHFGIDQDAVDGCANRAFRTGYMLDTSEIDRHSHLVGLIKSITDRDGHCAADVPAAAACWSA